MNKIRKGDTVIINTGKDKGKQGIVLQLIEGGKVLVEGLNMVKKHTKPNPAKGEQGGLISKEMPLQISNIAIFNSAAKKAACCCSLEVNLFLEEYPEVLEPNLFPITAPIRPPIGPPIEKPNMPPIIEFKKLIKSFRLKKI